MYFLDLLRIQVDNYPAEQRAAYSRLVLLRCRLVLPESVQVIEQGDSAVHVDLGGERQAGKPILQLGFLCMIPLQGHNLVDDELADIFQAPCDLGALVLNGSALLITDRRCQGPFAPIGREMELPNDLSHLFIDYAGIDKTKLMASRPIQ